MSGGDRHAAGAPLDPDRACRRRSGPARACWFRQPSINPARAGHEPRSRGTATRAAMAGSRLYGGPMASVKQIQVTFDCVEPQRVARFWCEVAGVRRTVPPEGFATWDHYDRALPPERQGSWFACVDPSGAGPRLFFQRVPDSTTAGFPEPCNESAISPRA
jgi:Glyoxalase-like domain